MSKPFDSTLKQLLADFAIDWISWLAPQVGLPSDVEVEPLDADLSTVQLAADKVFRLRPPAEGVLHIEPQSSWDGTLPDRLHLYSSLLHERYGGPVYSIAMLLRREANSPSLSGFLTRRHPTGREYLRFEYDVVRVWQLRMEPLLQAGPGMYPLALLTDEAENHLGELVDQMDARMRAENLPDSTRVMVHTSSMLLLGLRYNEDVIHQAFLRSRGMKESTTYQAILREGRREGLLLGREEGLLAARQDDLVDLLQERFGVVPDQLEQEIRNTTDLTRLRAAIRRAIHIASLAEFTL